MSKGSSLPILLSVTTLLFSITTFAQTTFTNVTRDAGLLEVKRYLSLGVTWADYDNDGDLDLYVSHGIGLAGRWKPMSFIETTVMAHLQM